MALTLQEQEELNRLEKEESLYNSAMAQQPNSGGLSDAEKRELAQLEFEEDVYQKTIAKNNSEMSDAKRFAEFSERPEAELGIIDRARYSIEPLKSNRIALLQQQFGAQNVLESPQGDLYLRTKDTGEFRPVNAPGFSTADVADVAGSLPEMTLGGIGAVAGVGAGSVPGLIAGGVAGSAARQGISSLLGTPQVADPTERGVELALSGGLALAGGKIGKHVGKGVNSLLKKVGQKIAPEATEQAMKMGKVAAKRGIKLTTGQRVGGIVEDQEKLLRESPLFGRKARKQLQKQIGQVVDELRKDVGNFYSPDASPAQVGDQIKRLSNSKIETLKGASRELFEETAKTAEGVFIPAISAKKSLLKGVAGVRLFDDAGRPLKYKGTQGVSKEAFDGMQKALKPIIEAIDESIKEPKTLGIGAIERSGKISINELNAIRKTLDAQIKSFGRKGKDMGYDDVVLMKIRNRFMDTIESGLGKSDPSSAEKFKMARRLWHEGKKTEDLAKALRVDYSNTKEIADEKILNKIFTDTQSLKRFEDIAGKDAVADAGKAYIQNLFYDKLSSGKLGAGAIKSAMSKRGPREALEKSIGKSKVSDIIELLDFMQAANIPINPSQTATSQLKQLTPSALMAGIGSRTILGLVEGTVKLPSGGVKALIQGYGQESKRKAGFATRKKIKPMGVIR